MATKNAILPATLAMDKENIDPRSCVRCVPSPKCVSPLPQWHPRIPLQDITAAIQVPGEDLKVRKVIEKLQVSCNQEVLKMMNEQAGTKKKKKKALGTAINAMPKSFR